VCHLLLHQKLRSPLTVGLTPEAENQTSNISKMHYLILASTDTSEAAAAIILMLAMVIPAVLHAHRQTLKSGFLALKQKSLKLIRMFRP
jgi:hypothetical protein